MREDRSTDLIRAHLFIRWCNMHNHIPVSLDDYTIFGRVKRARFSSPVALVWKNGAWQLDKKKEETGDPCAVLGCAEHAAAGLYLCAEHREEWREGASTFYEFLEAKSAAPPPRGTAHGYDGHGGGCCCGAAKVKHEAHAKWCPAREEE